MALPPRTGPESTAAVAATLERAVVLHRSGELEQAAVLYQQALDSEPRHFDALRLLGMIAATRGDWPRALELGLAALQVNSADVATHCNCGAAFKALGDAEHALECYQHAVELAPEFAEVHTEIGVLLRALGRSEAALAAYDRAIGANPRLAAAHFNRGNVLRDLARPAEALACYDEVIRLAPDLAAAHAARGELLLAQRDWQAALACFDAAISLRADGAEVHANRGTALAELGDYAAALASYDRALSRDPGKASAHANRGAVLAHALQFEAALESLDRAIELDSRNAQAHANRGIVLRELRRLPAALESFDRAIDVDPELATAYFNKALTLLLAGALRDGFRLHEWRWRAPNTSTFADRRRFAQPLWLGAEDLSGKTILLHAEQGLGDTLQFSRFAPTVAQLGARVVLEAQPPLVPLLATLSGVAQVIARGDPLPACDFQCPLLSLPLAFGTGADSVPAPHRYLHSNPAAVDQWQARLGAARRPRIGLVWSGNAHYPLDHLRSIPLAQLLAHLPPADEMHYISLQRDMNAADRATLLATPDLFVAPREELDFCATAALIDCLDLVISVDTSLAHLSAALGRPTWLLLSRYSDWRWQVDRTDSPWYPSVVLHRQRAPGAWDEVLAQVGAHLRKH